MNNVDCVWNVMVHAQNPGFVFRRNGRVHLNWRGRQFSRNTGSRGVRISGSNAGYTMFRGGVKGTGYPLHSLPLSCVIVCYHISAGLYYRIFFHADKSHCKSRAADVATFPWLNWLKPFFHLCMRFFTITMTNFINYFLRLLYCIKNQQDATVAVLFISHCKITLHVSDTFCVHHQEY